MNAEEIARLFDTHERYRVDRLRPDTCYHAELIAALSSYADGSGPVRVTHLGASLEGRQILDVQFGSGPVPVLLWSQMHGDETTATLALCDLFACISQSRPAPSWMDHLLRRLTVHAIPMLNPDGAERRHRCTATLIDLNRDAVALRTPEARILKAAREMLCPAFAFNLHDQGVSSVGQSNAVAALALLAPPPDAARTVTPARLTAMKLGAVLARSLRPFADGHLATYDDTHEPRAFGDLFQALGTPTLLIESGQWPGDPEKNYVRRLNFTGLLAALSAIADGSAAQADVADYSALPVNGRLVVDLIIRNVRLHGPNGWSDVVGLALTRERSRGGALVLREVGEVDVYGALRVIDAGGVSVESSQLTLDEPLNPGLVPGAA